ncbi:PGPGW domain-containing protein [Brevibacterium casei]|uniref:PGPGW domain-containing protein n=1 Tax=Brevibacterium casei TaxID=33889 RepID=UPI001EE8F98D|nr:PGPGW domain-containing protein [Brevibacterium casei]MCT2207120.1 TIGR02611 family protein [Brevibacterium casei]
MADVDERPPDKRPAGWLSRHHKHGRPSWRRFRLGFLRWRMSVTANPHAARLYRFLVGGVGSLIVVIGLILVPLPGPGWLIVIIGLFVISTEFHWARHLLHFVRVRVEAWTHWIMRQPLWVRWAVGALTAAFVACVVWLVLRLIGIPDWVPHFGGVFEALDLR